MKKTFARIVCILLAGALACSLGCGNRKIDRNEETPLVISSEPMDGVFNPFFYTSGTDGAAVGETQISMLTVDKDGNIVAGDEYPSVSKAYYVKTTGSQADFDSDGDYSRYYTDYYFAIKDNIVFSDGVPLTIKDVLFNVYMYLDPVYTGSSTMYSIDIKGLKAYRTQTEDKESQDNFDKNVAAKAQQRLDEIISWCNSQTSTPADQSAEMKDDIAKAKELFREELNSDWNASVSAQEEYEKYVNDKDPSKKLTETWEIFLAKEGVITTKVEKDPKDPTKKLYTFSYNDTDVLENHTQAYLVDYVYNNYMSEENSSYKDKLKTVITQWQTSNTLREYLVASEKGKLLNGDGEKIISSVSGVTTFRSSTIPSDKGDVKLGKELDILKIRVNGVDPKAIYNFSFTVAPMHYYSTKEAIDGFKQVASSTDEDGHTLNNYVGFGVKFSTPKFMTDMSTIRVPLGAGAYRATNSGKDGTDPKKKLDISEFSNNNIVYFERNENFIMGKPKIRFMRYKVIAVNQMVDAVVGNNQEVHVSMPTVTNAVVDKLNSKPEFKQITVDNMGYGYIGVNASYIKNVNIRRAIMHAMDPNLCMDYFGSSKYASVVYRSMSKNNWAYPKDATEAYYKYDPTGETSLGLVQEIGCMPGDDGILRYEGTPLKYTFTVAGETENHPAYQTMKKAADILNAIGFDITVTKDSQALSKLASGKLQVWAAAWSSTIDPDLYQVYHMESTASSVKNWGYPFILSDDCRDGSREIVEDLSAIIEDARETTDRSVRKAYYADALDMIMDLAVELPTYQRKNMYLIDTRVIDESTLSEATVHQSPLAEIWKVSFKD